MTRLLNRGCSGVGGELRKAMLAVSGPMASGVMALALVAILCNLTARTTKAQEPPYFVTYSQALEEPGNLEVSLMGMTAQPKDANGFFSPTLELEYGIKAWWTTELYLQGVAVANDSTIFTGFRWENRFRVLATEHRVNPVLYMEYEDINGADRSVLEVVGNDGIGDLQGSNAASRGEVQRELEGKLILSSNARGWNFSQNTIAEKNLMGGPWEFGYALGASRPLALAAEARNCALCRERWAAGAEIYGGLGTTQSLGLHDTSHYAGPEVSYTPPRGPQIDFSPQFGLNANSASLLWRFKVSYEIQQFRDWFGRGGAR
ncbi:MAG TPA: hypothetical protein VFU68_04735 [Terracidiphilus sp.]|nr:hypothetical protein [Terracidiphilus sp.]